MDRLGGDFDAFDAGREFDDDSDDTGYDDGAHSNPPPSPVGQDERRKQVRAYNHWSSLLGDNNLPNIEDLEPEFLGDFGPYSVLFDFSTGSATPTLQFIGEELMKECRELEPIETLQEIPQGSLLSRIADNYLKVVQAQAPVTFEAESPNAKGKTVAYRGILLPYSSDHDTIDFVYAVVNWKEVADAHTADALLEEIDRAMDYGKTADEPEPEVEAEPAPTAEIVRFDSQEQDEEVAEESAFDDEGDHWDSEDNILELRGAALNESGVFGDLPSPSFGDCEEEPEDEIDDEDFEANDPAIYAAADSQPEEAVTEETLPFQDAAPKRNRLTDALGNPIGGAPAGEEQFDDSAQGGITTAADYGLPDWDEEEPEEEDVDEVVNPLADIDLNSRLLSLVNAGTRGKKTVDLATLSETPEPEEAEEADAGKLFRPKAPSVDSLLSPEPYDEEDEFEEAYDGDAVDEEAYGYEPTQVEEEFPDYVEPVVEASEAPEEVEEVSGEESEPLELAEVDVPEVDSFEQPAARPSLELADPEDEPEADYAPLELSEEAIVEEIVHEEPEVAEQPEPEVVEAEVQAEEFEEPLELDQEFEEVEAELEPEPVDYYDVAPVESVQEVAVVDHAEPESLTGLLAAVRELSEAARTTDDAARRALYEAVGRAFDVSIKAVMASEHGARAAHDVIEHFPVDAVARSGPDMALVMVRRHANGDTEVLGEVPHDSILMESAQRKLANQ